MCDTDESPCIETDSNPLENPRQMFELQAKHLLDQLKQVNPLDDLQLRDVKSILEASYPNNFVSTVNDDLKRMLNQILEKVCDLDDFDLAMDMAKLLITFGASPNGDTICPPESESHLEMSPLAMAAEVSNAELCLFLISKGAYVGTEFLYHVCYDNDVQLTKICMKEWQLSEINLREGLIGSYWVWKQDYYRKFAWLKTVVALGIKAKYFSVSVFMDMIIRQIDTADQFELTPNTKPLCITSTVRLAHITRMFILVGTPEFDAREAQIDVQHALLKVHQPHCDRYPQYKDLITFIKNTILPLLGLPRDQVYRSLDPPTINHQKQDFKIMMLKRYAELQHFTDAFTLYELCDTFSALKNWFRFAFAGIHHTFSEILPKIGNRIRDCKDMMLMVLSYHSPILHGRYMRAMTLARLRRDTASIEFLNGFAFQKGEIKNGNKRMKIQ